MPGRGDGSFSFVLFTKIQKKPSETKPPTVSWPRARERERRSDGDGTGGDLDVARTA